MSLNNETINYIRNQICHFTCCQKFLTVINTQVVVVLQILPTMKSNKQTERINMTSHIQLLYSNIKPLSLCKFDWIRSGICVRFISSAYWCIGKWFESSVS